MHNILKYLIYHQGNFLVFHSWILVCRSLWRWKWIKPFSSLLYLWLVYLSPLRQQHLSAMAEIDMTGDFHTEQREQAELDRGVVCLEAEEGQSSASLSSVFWSSSLEGEFYLLLIFFAPRGYSLAQCFIIEPIFSSMKYFPRPHQKRFKICILVPSPSVILKMFEVWLAVLKTLRHCAIIWKIFQTSIWMNIYKPFVCKLQTKKL